MAERAHPTGFETDRTTAGREWELFVAADGESTRHAGSVSAPTAELAREQASRLLGWGVDDVWLCSADDITWSATTEHPR